MWSYILKLTISLSDSHSILILILYKNKAKIAKLLKSLNCPWEYGTIYITLVCTRVLNIKIPEEPCKPVTAVLNQSPPLYFNKQSLCNIQTLNKKKYESGCE